MIENGRSDLDFLADLRAAVERFLEAVDRWEAAYQKYYRLPGYETVISPDLEAEHRAFGERRRALEELLPRARRLCLRHSLRDALCGLPRVSLGRFAPQQRTDSAIGRNERSAAAKCLLDLEEACREWAPAGDPDARPSGDERSLLRRVVSFFY